MAARLTTLILAALVAAILAPAASASDAQNRVRAFLLAAPTHTGPAAAEKSCMHPATTTRRPGFTAGFCVATKGAPRIAGGAPRAYEEALAGGKHAGFLRNYQGRAPGELDRGMRSLERQIAEHEAKIADPARHLPAFERLDPRQQQALRTKKWPGDIQRQQEQLEILRFLRHGG